MSSRPRTEVACAGVRFRKALLVPTKRSILGGATGTRARSISPERARVATNSIDSSLQHPSQSNRHLEVDAPIFFVSLFSLPTLFEPLARPGFDHAPMDER